MHITAPIHRALAHAKDLIARAQPDVMADETERIIKRHWQNGELEINAATMSTTGRNHTSLDVWYRHKPVFTISYNGHIRCFKYEPGEWEQALEEAYHGIDTTEASFSRESQPEYRLGA